MIKVTVIPATITIRSKAQAADNAVKRRVAAYARVSTDFEEQLTSFEAQVDYYTKYIKDNPNWKFVEVYTDEGISATTTRHRDGFKRMIGDALAGKIDLIVTKSVSRFARNTVDTLTTVRSLKEHGVEVYFQKENIYTLDSKGEMLITIMSSLAQEESRSLSENVTWGQRKRFADGKVSMPYKAFLGYRKGADGGPEIEPDEAELVKRIYRLYNQGRSPSEISRILSDEGIRTKSNKTYTYTYIERLLANEKYKGAAILQKTFTVDFLTKTHKKNEGEVPQYYVENSHAAIIDPEEWDYIQEKTAAMKAEGRQPIASQNSSTAFSGKLLCGDCGNMYGPKIWHSTAPYRRIVWRCNQKYAKGRGKFCSTPSVYEDDLMEMFGRAVS
ncbi:MAG: recombinase family protein, partial [Clostridia bacterium]|nr:recombinase family protein [Clostridia bacterium]